MIPVPQALETVLTQTAQTLWLLEQGKQSNNANAPSPLPSNRKLIGRRSAMDVKAPFPGYPPHNSSIMDGYAIKTSELEKSRSVYIAMKRDQQDKYILDFDVVGKVYAGDDGEYESGYPNGVTSANGNCRTAVYVTTGAVVPAGYDAVIPVEHTSASTGSILGRMHIIPSETKSILDSIKPWTWIRTVGIDIPEDCVVLSKGEKIQPVHMALLPQIGISLDEIQLKRLPRVGVLSTGNELSVPSKLSSGSQHLRGKIPDVNRPLLLSQLSTYENCIPIDLGIVSDDDSHKIIAQKLRNMLWAANDEGIEVLITTGGISMGEKDTMEQVFVQGMGGVVHFGRMNMKPGKPTIFITLERDTDEGRCKKLIFALPGNPVSASVCTELLVRPCLDLLHHGADLNEQNSSMESFTDQVVKNARVHEEVMATITSDIKLDQGRPEYRRVALQRVASSDGHDKQQYTYHATDTGVQRSSRVLSLRGSDGLMMLPCGGTLGCGYDIARRGMEFPVLLYSSVSSTSETCFKDSMHRAMWKPDQHTHDIILHPKLSLGVIVCVPNERVPNAERDDNDLQSIGATLVHSLGGGKVALVQRAICSVPNDAKDDVFAHQFSVIVKGQHMEGANVIFVVVSTDSHAKDGGSSSIAFRAGLVVSCALRPIIDKNAKAMALRVKKYATLHDPLAALFENVVGTVYDSSCLVITCSDRGLKGAVDAVKALLAHMIDPV